MVSNTLEAWRDRFDQENACPWPGPRSIRPRRRNDAGDYDLTEFAGQLVGREQDVSRLAIACDSNDLLVVHGESGVGKTSILHMGLIPQLKELGKTVILSDKWGTDSEMTPVRHIFGPALAKGFITQETYDLLSADDHDGVNRRAPNRLIVLLDQFEELVRSNPRFAHEVISWLERMVGRTSMKFVISLRSEYEHQLRGLRIRPFSLRERFEIKPLSSLATIESVIASGRPMGSGIEPIDKGARKKLVKWWDVATADLDVWNRPGLLHLQAILYVLWTRRPAGADPELPITTADVNRLERDFSKHAAATAADAYAPGRSSASSIFDFALVRSVESSIKNCIAASAEHKESGWRGVSPVLTDMTRWIVRDITEHLASGGYKAPRDVDWLAERVLPHGRITEDSPPSAALQVARELRERDDWLDVGRSALNIKSGERTPLGSGPASNLTSAELLVEHYRSYYLALEWLRAANIIQRVAWGRSTVVTLTHDRFSDGLASWRKAQESSFDESIWRFAAHRGEDLRWSAQQTVTASSDEPRVVANVRWLDCTIGNTEFRNTLFINCNFAGSTFEACTFAGATFVNCVLDDVDFNSCRIVGHATWHPDTLDNDGVENPPQFNIPVPAALASRLATLNDPDAMFADDAPAYLHSGLSDDLAWPVAGVPPVIDPERDPQLPLRPGGLTMCGGRLSSLTFRQCVFTSTTATVSLRHIGGTSLEVCEQTHGRFDIFAAAIRGLTVTRPVTAKRPTSTEGKRPTFRFTIKRAKLINVWFGIDLDGSAELNDCKVWQLFNASPRPKTSLSSGFAVTTKGSEFFGLVNTGVPTGDSGPAPFTIDDLGGRQKEIREVSHNIDYRRA